MLVLSRKESESILIGDNVRITVITASDGRARIGIEAPRHVHILRQELSADAYPRSVASCQERGTTNAQPMLSQLAARQESASQQRSQAAQPTGASPAIPLDSPQLDTAPLAAFIAAQ